MILKEYLLSQGFEQRTSYQFHNDSYIVTLVQDLDSYGFEIWSITNKRFDEMMFRGRIPSIEWFKKILIMVKEDYDLLPEEISRINIL